MWKHLVGRALIPVWASAALLGATGTEARAQEPASAIIVFDGSGSMAGNIEGVRESKVVIARAAVRRAISKVGARQTRLGLVAFGHRRGDCGDIEMLRPLEPLDAQHFADPLDRVNPRGRGPITTALREAAKALPPGPGKRSLILIHDDADNCQQNVCLAAEELRRSGVIAHVVGLGLRPDDAARMACLPQLTGGRFINTRTAEQVDAAVEEALRLASAEGPGTDPSLPATAAQASAQPVGSPSAAIPADGPPGLYLRALLATGATPLSQPFDWTVVTDGQPAKTVFAVRAANPYVSVPAGHYVVSARVGAVSASASFDVDDKLPTPANLVLNAGTLQIKAQLQKSGTLLGDAVISVSDVAQAVEGKKEVAASPIDMFKGADGQMTLPAGRYLVRVEQGQMRVERPVKVEAGSQGRVDIALDAARLTLSVTGHDTSPAAEPIVFSIAEDDPDAPKGRREIVRSAAKLADFVLPPGTYYAVARQGSVETRERLAIGPGDAVKRTLNLAVGRLALSTKAAGNAADPPGLASYRVERLDGGAQEVISTSRPAPVLVLPGGRYRVEGRYGAMNVRTVREIELKAGQTQQLTLEPSSATLRLRLQANGAPVLADVLWVITDEAGATVWTTGQAEPSATLQAGRYLVRAETREKRFDKSIELRAGEARSLDIAAD